MYQIIESGATIIFVSHSTEQVRSICRRAIWLEKGQMVMDGPVDEVCDRYMET